MDDLCVLMPKSPQRAPLLHSGVVILSLLFLIAAGTTIYPAAIASHLLPTKVFTHSTFGLSRHQTHGGNLPVWPVPRGSGGALLQADLQPLPSDMHPTAVVNGRPLLRNALDYILGTTALMVFAVVAYYVHRRVNTTESPAISEVTAMYTFFGRKLGPARGLVPLQKPPLKTSVLLNRLEKQHAELMRKYSAGQGGVQLKELIVSVRAKPGAQVVPDLCVWVPVSSLVLVGKEDTLKTITNEAAVASFCKEIFECLVQYSPKMWDLGRTTLEYAVEPRGSWEENVANKKRYSKTDARYKDLGLEPSADVAAVKAAYRRLQVELRPENFTDPVEKAEAAKKLQTATDAHNALAVYKNGLYYWYSALEGNGRPEFSGLLDLRGLTLGQPLPGLDVPLEDGGLRAAVAKLNSPLTKDILRFNCLRFNEGIQTTKPSAV